MDEVIHGFVTKDAIDDGGAGGVGQEFVLAQDARMFGRCRRDEVLHEHLEAQAIQRMVWIFEIIPLNEAIPGPKPVDRFAHERDGGKRLSGLRRDVGSQMGGEIARAHMLERFRAGDGNCGK